MHNRVGESIGRFSSGQSQVESYKSRSRLPSRSAEMGEIPLRDPSKHRCFAD